LQGQESVSKRKARSIDDRVTTKIMGFYPVFLDIFRRRCVVIGGGPVAERRVGGLLASGADLTLISPMVTDRLKQLAAQGAIRYLERGYEPGDLASYELVFVATDDGVLNQAVFSEARSRAVWVNSADDPENCDFILPAVIRRGELAVAISTGGASPAVTRMIREELENYFTADYARLVQIAGEVRRELRENSIVVSPRIWNEALTGEFRRLLKKDQNGPAKELLLKTLGTNS
jgi:precorrin-2 dehydrogenase/sirohydrochlorin ferrochelatase